MNYITEVTFNNPSWKKRVGGLESLSFKPWVNILAGPNGSGKSSVVSAISENKRRSSEVSVKLENKDAFSFYTYDFERQNPRHANEIKEGCAFFQVSSHFASHGEWVVQILGFLSTPKVEGCLLILDEPEQALDLQNMIDLLKKLKETKATQVIIATHAPELILHPEFNVIELRKGYREKVYKQLSRVCKGYKKRLPGSI